jgi:hypothetical protein
MKHAGDGMHQTDWTLILHNISFQEWTKISVNSIA